MKALRLAPLAEKASSRMKWLMLMLVLAMVTGCPASDKEEDRCVAADDWGSEVSTSFRVPANKPFTSAAGLIVENGAKIKVEIKADHIDICPDEAAFESYAVPMTTENGIKKILNPISPMLNKWQPASYQIETGKDTNGAPVFETRYITVTENSKISINVYGTYKDMNGKQSLGKGLYVYIGDNPPEEKNWRWWYGEQYASSGVTNAKSGDNRKAAGKGDGFFELYDNGSLGNEAPGYSGLAPKSGKLWFKYARNASARGIDNEGAQQSSPWLGRYAWDTDSCNACRHETIMLGICVPFIALPPAYALCIATAEAACAATYHLPQSENPDQRNINGKLCREGYGEGGGDHWVDNAYDGSEWDYSDPKANPPGSYPDGKTKNPNGGGYQIAVTSGCDGTYGQFMEMHIGVSQAALVDKTFPEGCVIGKDEPCEVVKGEWGETIKEPLYSVPDAHVTNMDMRNKIDDVPNGNPGFVRTGHYAGTVGATGELWFHIKDDKTTSKHPEAGYYGDNLGEYEVVVTTKPVSTFLSDSFNALINPIRGMIFGYCRVPGDPKLQYKTSEKGCSDYTLPGDVDENGELIKHPGWKPGITQMMYNKLVGVTDDGSNRSTTAFLSAVRAALVLYVIIYAGLFMMGMVNDRQEGFMKRIVKFSFVAALLSEGSWQFFNTYLFQLFTHGIDDFIGMLTIQFAPDDLNLLVDPVTGEVIKNGSGSGGTTNIFAFADMTASKFLNLATFKKILGLLFASPIGILYVLLICAGMLLFLLALVKALILYLLALLAISLLLMVAPIFISFMLFERTKGLFDGWVKNLINYTFQPVLVFATLSVFNVFVYTAIYHLLNYGVCWDTVWSYYINAGELSTGPYSLFKFYLPVDSYATVVNSAPGAISSTATYHSGSAHLGSLPVQFFMIFIFIIICSAMLIFIDWMADMAAQITSEARSTSLSKITAQTFNSGQDIVKRVAGTAFGAATKGIKTARKEVAKRTGGDGNSTSTKV
ncbi:MAG: TrbL/VirB6 plasmid conjugal transfer protein [Rickettsiaceae bacterium]|jgi:type IV secretory pathway VirB6-like protein|nr:TrbL/VirB6 plasmid conjugal transfer protein [Rickettsiaceae bacterium]